jgi:hypothetical protein
VSDQQQPVTTLNQPSGDAGFVWHPVHRGRSFQEVRTELVQDISRDQRAYKLAMDGAEGAEHDSLTTIVELERRWSTYEFDWAETDPEHLADRILKFERACEDRKEAMSFADYRASGALVANEEPDAAEPTRSLPIMQIGAAILAVLIIIFVIAVFA